MKRRFLLIVSSVLLLAACESYDCTLYNTVAIYGSIYKDGAAVKLNDTLTITACGTDNVLLNRAVGVSKLTLSLSYLQDEDTLVLSLQGADYFLRDTIWVTKSNMVHYESPDCPTTYFHTIQDIRSTNEFINSITVIRSSVNYETTDNIQINLHPSPEPEPEPEPDSEPDSE